MGRDGWEVWNGRVYLRWITNEDLCYSTGNCSNVVWQLEWEESLGAEMGHVHG